MLGRQRISHPKVFVLTSMLVASVSLNVLLARKIALQKRVAEASRSEHQLMVGSIVPAFTAKMIDGRGVLVSYLEDGPSTVLYVFTPACGWCARNIENIKALAELKRGEYNLLGLSLSDDGLREYATKYDLNFPVYGGLSVETVQAYKLGGTPQTIVVSPEGHVLKSWVGAYAEGTKREVEQFSMSPFRAFLYRQKVSELLAPRGVARNGVPRCCLGEDGVCVMNATLVAILTPLVALWLTTQQPVSATGMRERQSPAAEPKPHQQTPVQDKNKQSLPPAFKQRDAELERLVSVARAAPPEVAADALTRVAESSRLTDFEWRRDLLEEALTQSLSAQELVKRVYPPGGSADTRDAALAMGFKAGLDAMSLQTRVIKLMLALDVRRARQLLMQVPPPRIPPLNCEDVLLYDVASFYGMLADTAKTAFSKEEIRQGHIEQLIGPYVYEMTSPVQVVPILRCIMSLPIGSEQRTVLILTFSEALSKISGDDRSFTITLDSVVEDIAYQAAICRGSGIRTTELLRALRQYLVTHLEGTRCADTAGPKAHWSKSTSAAIAYFNTNVRDRVYARTDEIPSINIDDLKAPDIKTAAETHQFWITPESRKLANRISRLRFGTGTTELSASERSSSEWEQEYQKLMGDLRAWDGASERAEVDYFHQKAYLLEAMFELAPTVDLRDDALRNAIDFLESRRDRRIELIPHINRIIQIAHSASDATRSDLLEKLSRSNNPTIVLYADIERALPDK